MPKMSKRQKDHVASILADAIVEVEKGAWNNALLITRHATTQILLLDGKQVSVTAGARAAKVGTGQSSSLIAGFNILAAYKPGVTLLGIAELADKAEMSRSTTHRYVRTLVTLGQLEQDPATRKYRRI
jgi:hypothetical protein